jgi:hypothetical protein
MKEKRKKKETAKEMHETVDARAGGLPGPNNSADWATAVRPGVKTVRIFSDCI